jgi:hypothetical protein
VPHKSQSHPPVILAVADGLGNPLFRHMPPRSDGYVPPCIPSRAYTPPAGPDWVHEITHDGYCLQVRRAGDAVRLFTRRGYDWSGCYPDRGRRAIGSSEEPGQPGYDAGAGSGVVRRRASDRTR